MDHRTLIDSNEPLKKFAETLEKVIVETVEAGHMTKDLAILVKNTNKVAEGTDYLVTQAFMEAVDKNFQQKWAKIVS